MDKRKNTRFAAKLYVKLSSGSLTSWGLLGDVSEDGLFIRVNRNFMIGSLIDIEIFMPFHGTSFLHGVVRRLTDLPESIRKFGVGIEIVEKDAEYTRFLESLKGHLRRSVLTS